MYKILLANILFLIHAPTTLITAFGWWFPPLFYIQGLLLFATLLSWFLLGTCVLSVWEYKLRKSANPDLDDYEYGYLYYHMRHLFKNPPSLKFIRVAGLFYLFSGTSLWAFQFLYL